MAIDATALAAGALGGAVAQSILGPLFGQRHERRGFRAQVVRQVAEVENARWAPDSRGEFVRAVHELRTAALVAGLDREPVEFYVLMAAVARQASDDDFERSGGHDESGGIPVALADLTRQAAGLLTERAWRPYRSKARSRQRLSALINQQKGLQASQSSREEKIRWDSGLPKALGAV